MNTNDQASNISDNTQIYQYRSEAILTSNSASIDQKAQAIPHRTMLHAIDQNMMDTIKLSRENRIFISSLCNIAMSSGISRAAIIMIQK